MDWGIEDMRWPFVPETTFFLLDDNILMAYAERGLPDDILMKREPYIPFGKYVCRVDAAYVHELPRGEIHDIFAELFHIRFDAGNDVSDLLGTVVAPTGDIAIARHAHILPATRSRCLELLLAARFLAFSEADIRESDMKDSDRLLAGFANLGNGLTFDEEASLALLRQSFQVLPGSYQGMRWLEGRFLTPGFLPPACEDEENVYGWTIIREENAYYWKQTTSGLVPDMAFPSILSAFLTLEEWLYCLTRRGILPDEYMSAYELQGYMRQVFQIYKKE